jgi:hypothetical protein
MSFQEVIQAIIANAFFTVFRCTAFQRIHSVLTYSKPSAIVSEQIRDRAEPRQ